MSVDTAASTSRRGYLSQDELVQFANITINDTTEADDKISQAEELIDAYIGAQDKFYKGVLSGKAAGGSATSVTLQSSQQNAYDKDYFVGMEVEIVGGTAKGEIEKITASTKAGVLTTNTFGVTPDATSYYRIQQLGKFPRQKDVIFDSESGDNQYYKQIPEAVRRATAAQVEFEIEEGEAFLKTTKAEYASESLGDYSYSRMPSSILDRLIAPKAKQLLRGIANRKGTIRT